MVVQMRITHTVSVLLIVLGTGCGGGTSVPNDTIQAGTPNNESIDAGNGDNRPANSQELIAKYAGATFVSVDTLEVGPTATGVAMGNWLVRFNTDTVEWQYSDVVEVGTYSVDETTGPVAEFNGREVPFSGNGTSLTWDSRTYMRLAPSQFDSQESLVNYFDGLIYVSVEELDIGETATGELAMGRWSLRFDGNELTHQIQDTLQRATYTFVNGSAFNINTGATSNLAYVLTGDQLLVNSVIYEKSSISGFESQQALVNYLNGNTYQSAGLQQADTATDGVVAVGHWYLNFVGNTFTWDRTDTQEAGTYQLLGDTSFTATLADRELTAEFDRDDIIMDGIRYIRQ